MNNAITFLKFATSYEIQGGPTAEELLAALRGYNNGEYVTFTFIGEVDGSFISQNVDAQINNVASLESPDVFRIVANLVNAVDADIRLSIKHYDASTQHGSDASIFQ